MAMSPKLAMRQSQSLVMTPQLMQSIKLLQLSHLELSKFVEEEMERNPLLEAAPTGDALSSEPLPQSDKADDDWQNASGDGDFTGSADEDWMHQDLATTTGMSETFDAPLDNLFQDDAPAVPDQPLDLTSQWKTEAGGGGTFDGSDGFDFEDTIAKPESLREHVAEQIAFTFVDAGERLFAMELADCLDESGYLRTDLRESADKLGMPMHQAEVILAKCQEFDPLGLFGRDLAECLTIQLKAKDRFDPAMAMLVANLELLAKRDFKELKRLCGVDDADILDMLAEIRALDPKPGTAFATGAMEAIIPDVAVRAAQDGSWLIELNPAALPRVLVNQSYFTKVSRDAQNPTDKAYLSECLATANWLTRSLDQRARTILKVTEEIVKQQDAFFIYGVSRLRPLNLITVANAIKMHESTVSRVTANKFMETPRGVFELRYFFTAAINNSDGGDSHSAQSVRHTIRLMIESETQKNVLSDDQIVDALLKNGVDIARRTVAKYRESMNIPSSVQRRREKKLF